MRWAQEGRQGYTKWRLGLGLVTLSLDLLDLTFQEDLPPLYGLYLQVLLPNLRIWL